MIFCWQGGSPGNDVIRAVAALDDDCVVLAGFVNGIWNGEASLGTHDFAATKFDSNGTMQWYWHVSGHVEISSSGR